MAVLVSGEIYLENLFKRNRIERNKLHTPGDVIEF